MGAVNGVRYYMLDRKSEEMNPQFTYTEWLHLTMSKLGILNLNCHTVSKLGI